MELLNIVFRERSGYRDLFLRPFSANATHDDVEELGYLTENGREITPTALSKIAGRIIRPLSQVQSRSVIENGWGEKRLMFSMEVLARSGRNNRSVYQITGYTDYAGFHESLRGIVLDRKMHMYFNNVTRVETTYVEAPGRVSGWLNNTTGQHHILIPQRPARLERGIMEMGTLTQRPCDVFQSRPDSIMQTAFQRQVSRDASYHDTRNGFVSQRIKTSDRWNDSSSRYLNKTLSALFNREEDGSIMEPEESQLLMYARRATGERSFTQDKVFKDLADETNITDQGYITYGELVDLNPDFNWDDVMVFLEPKQKSAGGYLLDSCDWNGQDNTSIAAAQLARALPAYMAFHQISSIEFDATNDTPSGESVMVTSNAIPMMGRRLDQRKLNQLEQRFIDEILVEMLPWDGCFFEIHVKASISSDLVVNLTIGDEDPGRFVFPIFCDSLVSPVITDSNDTIEGMSNTLMGIYNKLADIDLDDSREPPGFGDLTSRSTETDF